MGWLENLRRRGAAKRYAQLLPRRLAEAYGRSKIYTKGQITTAVTFLKLDAGYIAYAYAMFLPEEAYQEATRELTFAPDRNVAIAEFDRFRPIDQGRWDSLDKMNSGVASGGR